MAQQAYPRKIICPTCVSSVTVYSKNEEARVAAGNGCGNWRCVK